MFSNTLYVRVDRNRFRMRHLEAGTDTAVLAESPFTTERLLAGQFTVAETLLKEAVKQTVRGKLFAVSPRMLMHPTQMLEGGLSQVEERSLYELGLAAGAMKVVVWTGRDLADIEVQEKLRAG